MTAFLCALLVLQFPVWSLRGETLDMLTALGNRGYTVFQYRGLLLELHESRRIPVIFSPGGDAIFGALGGPKALVVNLELMGGDEILFHSGTDDIPMIPVSADSAGMVSHIRLTLEQTTHGAAAESVFVYAVMKPVDPIGL